MSHWLGKRVLVTGAGGFIGSHLAEQLVELGANVTALVHYNALGSRGWLDHSEHVSSMRILAGDIQDSQMVRSAMQKADCVFHLAALIGIPYSYVAPASYVATNINGTLNVLQAARELEIPRVVHTSTSEVYGSAQYVPIDEKHPLQGQSPYSATKVGADKLAESYHLSFKTPVVTVRPFNTFGPRQSARAVIPTIIVQCLTGTRVKLGSLSPTRDLNFVSNTVEGFLKAGQSAQAIGGTFNLGSGREISVGALAAMIARLCNREVAIECDDQRIRPPGSEVDRLLANNALALEVLGWSPHVSLEDGLTRTVAWMSNQLHRYRPQEYLV